MIDNLQKRYFTYIIGLILLSLNLFSQKETKVAEVYCSDDTHKLPSKTVMNDRNSGITEMKAVIEKLDGWHAYKIDTTSTHPVIAIGSDNVPQILYFITRSGTNVERQINYATWQPTSRTFALENTHNAHVNPFGSIALDQNNMPHFSYHDHFFQGQVHTYKDETGWHTNYIDSQGHDGWSSSIVIDANNNARICFIDPMCCSTGAEGIELVQYDGDTWSVAPIGSENDLWIFNGTSMALNSEDRTHITFYNDVLESLMMAAEENGQWTFSIIDAEGDAGRWSALAFDENDLPHVSYFTYLGGRDGIVKYARYNGTDWETLNVDTLEYVQLSNNVKQQDLTDLRIDNLGNAHITYTDLLTANYAIIKDNTVLRKETYRSYEFGSEVTMAQSASLALDVEGVPHVTFWDVIPGTGTSTIGQGYYAYKPPVYASVTLNDGDLPVPATGGAISYELNVINNSALVKQPDIWIKMIAPGGKTKTIFSPKSPPLQPYAALNKLRSFELLERFPAGTYDVVTYIGTYPDVFISTDTTRFEKLSVTGKQLSKLKNGEFIPEKTTLLGNYPNPFNPETTIRYYLAEKTRVQIQVYNTSGQLIATLLNGEQDAGFRSIAWDGSTAIGVSAASGIYIYHLRTSKISQVRKMILLK